GRGAEWLNRQKDAERLDNLQILNYQPFEMMSELLGSGDVLVAILEADAGVYSVPSKVLSYLCAQRPVLLSVPSENLAARIVKENELGVVVPPGNDEEFIEAANELYKNPLLRWQYAQNAHRYAEQNFDIEKIAVKFLKIILD
ncbi:MAG: glycosyltransferase, partial [Anaerolineales bacterium]|nr:glycosyltransferase [Anaerolineales bacterium]